MPRARTTLRSCCCCCCCCSHCHCRRCCCIFKLFSVLWCARVWVDLHDEKTYMYVNGQVYERVRKYVGVHHHHHQQQQKGVYKCMDKLIHLNFRSARTQELEKRLVLSSYCRPHVSAGSGLDIVDNKGFTLIRCNVGHLKNIYSTIYN